MHLLRWSIIGYIPTNGMAVLRYYLQCLYHAICVLITAYWSLVREASALFAQSHLLPPVFYYPQCAVFIQCFARLLLHKRAPWSYPLCYCVFWYLGCISLAGRVRLECTDLFSSMVSTRTAVYAISGPFRLSVSIYF